MRALYCAAGLLISFACANAEEHHPPQTLAILFQFQHPYANRTLKEAERELNVLTKGAAVRLEWHDRGSLRPTSSYPNILVLDFLGDCDPRSESKFTGPLNGWLARMHVSDGVVLPFGDVNCDLVRAVMNEDTLAGVPSNAVFGRALARVIAHELFHFVTNSVDHSQAGITKPSFSPKDLAWDGLHLDRKALARMSNTFLP